MSTIAHHIKLCSNFQDYFEFLKEVFFLSVRTKNCQDYCEFLKEVFFLSVTHKGHPGTKNIFSKKVVPIIVNTFRIFVVTGCPF